MEVTIWHRTAAASSPTDPAVALGRIGRGYEPGDPITRVFDYEIDVDLTDAAAIVVEALAQAFRCFNGFPANDREHDLTRRYRAAGHRSLSVGDVVVIGEIAMSCEPFGWAPVSLPTTTER